MYDSSFHAQREQAAIVQQQQELAARIARLAPVDGVHTSALPDMALMRQSAPTAIMPAVYEPSLCVVVQGRKRALLHDEVYHYNAMNYLVVSVTLPVMGQILEASPAQPYLCLRIRLDLDEVSHLLLEPGIQRNTRPTADRGLYAASMNAPLLDAVLRLVKLLDTPEDLSVLGAVVQREIHYRLLRGELGHKLVDMVEADGGNQRIVRAIEWLKQRYDQPLRIEELAGAVHMSTSALHHRFKSVTAMSPLQYQKHLRLHAARRLMFADGMECASAAHRVGYESASQFSREYRRLFGAPPRAEIAKLRKAEPAV